MTGPRRRDHDDCRLDARDGAAQRTTTYPERVGAGAIARPGRAGRGALRRPRQPAGARGVFQEVEREGVDAIVCGGDVCAGLMPRECLAALEGAVFVRGNADRELSRWLVAESASSSAPSSRDSPHGDARRGRPRADAVLPRDPPARRRDRHTRDPRRRVRVALAGVDERVVVAGHVHVQVDRAVAGAAVRQRRQCRHAVRGSSRKPSGAARP